MTTETIRLAIYAQHCRGTAGDVCHDEDGRDENDLDIYEGTADELRAQANQYAALIEAGKFGAGDDAYYARVVRSIRESL